MNWSKYISNRRKFANGSFIAMQLTNLTSQTPRRSSLTFSPHRAPALRTTFKFAIFWNYPENIRSQSRVIIGRVGMSFSGFTQRETLILEVF